jgi:hypothetical protein
MQLRRYAQAAYRGTRVSATLSAKRGFFAAAPSITRSTPTTEESFQVLLEAEVAVEECGRVTPLDGNHEIQVAVLAVEPFSRRRAEQVEALDAVATADLPYLFDAVLDERIHGSTLP